MSRIEDPNRVIIFDTTLRDGEQSPGASMNLQEKLTVAKALRELGVDIIEAGFPISSPGDFEAVQAVARHIQGPTIAGLARCVKGDIEAAANALRDAAHKRIHVFLATSAIHRRYKLRMAKDEIVRRTRDGVAMAKAFTDDVEFSPEDGSRTEPEFLAEVCEAAIDAGATTVNIPDTVGYAMPSPFFDLIRYLKQNVRNIDRAVISVHCHNDLGLAVANSLSALQAGARQVECTINGIGERAGNCSLEELVMALRTRRDYFGLFTGVNTKSIYAASQAVCQATGMTVQRNKAIVGQNAFAHEAGIHQHGVLQHKETYEIMRPEDVGLSTNALVLGKHSGLHAFRDWAERHGFSCSEPQLREKFHHFKALCDEKKHLTDQEIAAIFEGEQEKGPWNVEGIRTANGNGGRPSATVCLRYFDGRLFESSGEENCLMRATFNAINAIIKIPARLKAFELVGNSTSGHSNSEVRVAIEYNGSEFSSCASGNDAIHGFVQATLGVFNQFSKTTAAARIAALTPACMAD